ncbi:unnamed protein product [Rhizoctonia solani]|uniref:Uncharacterized protein n=1 Tax=Rhizoctonia solani TaxID=456999 RepID=A0A8H3AEC4_9AGAM|nr:unnamed protein product [Rhizoctonia solani]
MTRYGYLRKYASDGTWSPSTPTETIRQAQTAISAIRNNHDVSITMLESVISLTYHPISLMELLGDPGLIRDCILYLCQREKEGVQVFDDEQGYLYFRILLLAINISVISDFDCPAFWNVLGSKDGKEDASQMLSRGVEVFIAQRAGDHPDQLLDWDLPTPGEPIISQRYALLLLGLLFKDRKGLLRVCSETRSPTLTGVLFVLWRLVHITGTPTLWTYFIDIAKRNYLVAGDNVTPIQIFEEDARAHSQIWHSRNASIAVDLEDARTQLLLLTKKMHFEPARGPSAVSFSMLAPSLILYFSPNSKVGFISGVEDLFLPLIQELFAGFWRYLEIGDNPIFVPPEVFVNHFGAIMLINNCMIQHLIDHPPIAAGVTSKEALQATVDLGVIELMSQSIILIDDYNGEEVGGKK